MGSHQPSSADSRLSLSRTERCNQFTADSSSCVSKDEFPIFSKTGDVEITIRGAIAADGVEAISNTYLLHQDTLARCSGFFAASTSSQWSKAQSDPASVNERARDIGGDDDGVGGDKDGHGSTQNAFGSTRPKRQWKFELDHGTAWGDTPMLVQTDPLPAQQEGSGRAGDSQPSYSPLPSGLGSGGPTVSHTTLSSLKPMYGPPVTLNGSQRVFDANPDMRDELLGEDNRLLRNYGNLFRIFYNYRPMLEDAKVFLAFSQCQSLLRLADQYDALAAVRPCVDHHLLQFQSRLWESVSMNSRGFLEFSYLARSKAIFKEALIHTVGIWYLCIPQRPEFDVPDFVLDIVEDKVYELREKVSRVEGQLFRLSLTTEKGERVGPANDYLDWLVVSLFRQWLADNTKPQMWPACNNNDNDNESESDNSHHSDIDNALIPPIDIYFVYRKLGSDSPSAFLDHNDCEAFLALNPQLHTAENLVRFEKRMADLKALARDVVRPLLHNNLELDVASPNISEESMIKPFYFTCTSVEDDDIPWPLDLYIPL
ncbi:hypothetical protein E4U57_002420 [Claviceps arundinis]|uniref:Uncharacterized protein n=1 Tax=Claviceps arundinis TaxID=1623583 RepID=A0ABQ7PNC2_9HYPO|nr:hypothetical protein E4U57_002420 [Claviceps arundinis]